MNETAQSGTSIVSSLLTLYQQKQLMDINAERAKQGLPPINAADAGMQAQVGAQVGLDAATRNVVIAAIAAATLVGLAMVLRGR